MSSPFDRLRAAQESAAEPQYMTPSRVRLTALARIIAAWLDNGGASEADQQEMWAAIVAERLRLSEFLQQEAKARFELEESRLVHDNFVTGLQFHAQACDYLAQAMAEGQREACTEASRCLEEGDRRLETCEGHIERLRAIYPLR